MPAASQTNLQNYSSGFLLSILGAAGFSGISVAIASPASTLTITVAAGAFAVLNNGVVLTTVAAELEQTNAGGVLASTSIAGNTTNGTYTLWLDESTDGLHTPVWTIAAAATSNSGIAIAAITVAGNVITVATLKNTGVSFQANALAVATSVTAPAAGGAGALPATPLGYAIITVNGALQKIPYYANP